jgi:flavin reductase (DIM6/NTAB) family NADH-FMN oxidoreductase RutF
MPIGPDATKKGSTMTKVTFANQTALYPKPTVLVGAHVDGKPNFLTIALAGFICGDPPTIAVGIRPSRYTLKGIRQNMAFSVNIPSVDMVTETDYCGIVSGANVDKVSNCGFTIFYGTLDSAPLIEQCPVAMECEVLHILKLGSHDAIIGTVVETHVSEDCLTEGAPDITKINPIAFSREKHSKYYAIGACVGQAFSVGLEFKKKMTS